MFKKMDYVYAVYKEKSFTKAAERLYVSQPCLSAAIKKTENEIGFPLFERKYGDLHPTMIGYEYIRAAEKIMDIQDNFYSRISKITNMQYGKLTIGGSNYVSSYILPKIVSAFSGLYPEIEITLTESDSIGLKKMLEKEEIDVLIDSMDEEPPIFDCVPLVKEKILLAVPLSSECNTKNKNCYVTPQMIFESRVDLETLPVVSIKHFKNEKFILLKRGHSMHRHASELFVKNNFQPNVSFRLDQLSTSYTLANSGIGACFVPDTLFRHHRFANNVLLYNIEGIGTRTLFLAKKRTSVPSAVISKFTDIAIENI